MANYNTNRPTRETTPAKPCPKVTILDVQEPVAQRDSKVICTFDFQLAGVITLRGWRLMRGPRGEFVTSAAYRNDAGWHNYVDLPRNWNDAIKAAVDAWLDGPADPSGVSLFEGAAR